MKLHDDILEAIARHDINLELGTGWQAAINQNQAWISNESGKSICFTAQCAEHRLIKVLIDTQSVSSKTYPVASLARLIEIGALRIAHRTAHASSNRFKWQDEYFSAFVSPTNSLKDINQKLQESHVVIIGIGGLGGMLALLLASAGIGHISLVDGDLVEESNLPRQFLFKESSIGKAKVDVIREVLIAHNSKTQVTCHPHFITSQEDVEQFAKKSHFVALCADQPRIKIRAWFAAAVQLMNLPAIAMAANWIGPVTLPNCSPCYLCQSRTHRNRIADPQGFIKRATQESTPHRAAFGPGVASVAGPMASAIIHTLTGTLNPRMLSNAFRVSASGDFETQEFIRYRDCPACGHRHAN
jgi:molybdopterin/thiamine biosynthesis adenylyltransferase